MLEKKKKMSKIVHGGVFMASVDVVGKLVGIGQSSYVKEGGEFRYFCSLHFVFPYQENFSDYGKSDPQKTVGESFEGSSVEIVPLPRNVSISSLKIGAFYAFHYDIKTYGRKKVPILIDLIHVSDDDDNERERLEALSDGR